MSNPEKKKLLLIGPLPPPYAGPEIGTKTLLESTLLNQTYRIRHINTTVRASNKDKGKLDIMMLWAYIRYLSRLLHALLIFKPHYILYCPTSATLKGWVRDGTTSFLCGLFKTRLIMQFRGGHFRYFFDSIKPFYQKLIRGLLHKSALVLAQADVLKRQFIGIIPEKHIGKFYNSITPDFYASFESVERSRQNRQQVNILFVGHLSYAKGYCDLLKTLPDLSHKYAVHYQFMGAKIKVERNVLFNQATGEQIISEDPDECYIHYVKKKGLSQQVSFLGDRIYGTEKLKIFKEADIFVLPSYSEGFSMAILEAMAAGLPIIATKVGAAPEVIEEGEQGYIVIPGDIATLQDRLEQLVKDASKRIAMGQKNREKCQRQFFVEVASHRLVQLLENLK